LKNTEYCAAGGLDFAGSRAAVRRIRAVTIPSDSFCAKMFNRGQFKKSYRAKTPSTPIFGGLRAIVLVAVLANSVIRNVAEIQNIFA
jgi:hypothetical protein